jgi:hypothetical protein
MIRGATLLVLIATAAHAQVKDIRVEVGPEISQTYLPSKSIGSVPYQPAIGGVGCFKLRSFLWVDGALSLTPLKPITSTSFAGGRLFQANIGLRIDQALGGLTVGGKARPGLASFGQAIVKVDPDGIFHLGVLTVPSLI